MFECKLCDLTGAQIAHMDDRQPGAQVSVGLNDRRTARVPLHFEAEAAQSAYPLYTVQKVLYDDAPLFTGILLKPGFSWANRRVQINAIDQSYRLMTSFIGQRADADGLPGHVANAPWRWETVDQSEMISRLVEHVLPTAAETAAGVPGHGIIDGSLPASVNRDREYEPGKQVWEAILQLSQVMGGVDFELEPLDRTDGVLCKLNTFTPSQGADLSDTIVFEVGWGLDNAVDLSWEPAGDVVKNRSTFTGQSIEGQPQQAATSNQPESQQAFGIYADFQGRPDIIVQETLEEHAQGVVSTAGWPIDFFKLTLPADDGTGWRREDGALVRVEQRFGQAPTFGPGPRHDFWLGDTIRVIARDRDGVSVDLAGRVTDGTLTETETGAVVAEIECAPEVDATGVI